MSVTNWAKHSSSYIVSRLLLCCWLSPNRPSSKNPEPDPVWDQDQTETPRKWSRDVLHPQTKISSILLRHSKHCSIFRDTSSLLENLWLASDSQHHSWWSSWLSSIVCKWYSLHGGLPARVKGHPPSPPPSNRPNFRWSRLTLTFQPPSSRWTAVNLQQSCLDSNDGGSSSGDTSTTDSGAANVNKHLRNQNKLPEKDPSRSRTISKQLAVLWEILQILSSFFSRELLNFVFFFCWTSPQWQTVWEQKL